MFLGLCKHLATDKLPEQKAAPKTATLLFVWSSVIVVALIVAIATEISARRHDYERDALTLIKETELRWGAQEAVLSGFAAFLKAVDKGDFLAAKRYAASALAPYPHVYMLEVARRVPARTVRAFERSMQIGQHKDYKVSSFGTEQEQRNFGANGDTWPIVFLYPEAPAVRSIYGIRLETVPYLTEALSKLEAGQGMVATKPFTLIEGGSGFMLLANVDRQDRKQSGASPDYFGSSMIAMLMMKSEDVIPNPPLVLGRIKADLLDSQGATRATLMTRPDRQSLWLDRFLLPTFTVQHAIKSKCLPVAITIEHQLLWRELATGRLVQFLVLIALAAYLGLRNIRAHQQSLILVDQAYQRAKYMAMHDALTGLPNRHLLMDRFKQSLHRGERNGLHSALLMVDLDLFKDINDLHGHETGDLVLQETARRLQARMRNSDTVARYGGDEFVIVLDELAPDADVDHIAQSILQSVNAPINIGSESIGITCSVGVALYPRDGKNYDSLSQAADKQMYEAKRQGRNTYHHSEKPVDNEAAEASST